MGRVRAVLLAVAFMAAAIGLDVVDGTNVSAAPTCVTGGSGFSATVCITVPSDGATVSGDVPVEISVDISGSATGVARLNTYLDGEWLLEDVAAPYSFVIPSYKFLDGTHVLTASATLRNGYVSPDASVTLDFANGVTTPPVNTNSRQPRTGTPVAPGSPLVFAATGDGAGGRTEADEVVSLMESWNPNLFTYLGDVYAKGTPTEFYNWYGHDGSKWDALNDITNPVTGNHEYENGLKGGYDDYWDNVPDYYSYDAGGWHFIALNSNAKGTNSVDIGSPQYQWLAADLAANTSQCTLAYFHHPVLSSGPQNDTPSMNDIWKLLVDNGTDIVLTGHDHQYQRFVPLDGNLQPSPTGATEFVAGGGGHGIQALVESDPRVAAYADIPPNAFGALRLELNSGGANFAYINTAGATLDSGVIGCGTSDSSAPTDPSDVVATAQSHYEVSLSWTASTDDVGVAGYTILRDGAPLVDVPSSPTSYVDSTAVPGATHTYGVQAFDDAGNRSVVVSAAPITMPPEPSSFAYDAIADAYVNAGSPTLNYGSATTLRVDQTPVMQTFMRFDVAGMSAPPASATLRIFTNSSQSTGFAVTTAPDTWAESTINYDNAPAIGPVIGTSGPVTGGTWVDIPIDASVFSAGNGTYDLALDPLSTTTISMASREDAGHAPQLVLGAAPIDSPPVADDVSLTATEDQVAGWTPVVSDPDGPTGLACSIASAPTNGTATVQPDCSSGTYTPATDFNGADSFTYEVSDGTSKDSGAVSVAVSPVNDAPQVTAPPTTSATAGVASTIEVQATDIDGDCPLTLSVLDPPTHGTVGSVDSGSCVGGTSSGSITYTPTAGYSGSDSFTVRAVDPAGAASNAVTVSADVQGPQADQTFSAVADTYVDESAPTSSFGSATQLRVDGSPLIQSYVRFDVSGISTSVTSAVLRIYADSSHNQGFQVATVTDPTWSEATTFDTRPTLGSVLGFSGATVAGTYVDVDVTGYVTGNGQVDLALLPLNSTNLRMSSREGANSPELFVTQATTGQMPPAAGDVAMTVDEDAGPTAWTPVVSDPDGPTGLTCSIVSGPTNGTATVAPDCSMGTYTPDPNFNGSDPFSYQVSDGSLTADATVSVTVTPVNDVPVAVADLLSTSQDADVVLTLVASDADGTCPLTFSIDTPPVHGTLGSITPVECTGGLATANITYTPAPGYIGPDSFSFVASDGTVSSAPAEIAIDVTSVQRDFSFVASEDAYVTSTASGSNFGSASQLRVDNSPDIRSYLRFQVSGLSSGVQSATLRIYVGGNNGGGFEVNAGSSAWSEGSITYVTAPVPGASLATSGAVSKGTWVDIPVTAVVTGNGQVDLVLVPVNGTNLPFSSRESAEPPQLLITTF